MADEFRFTCAEGHSWVSSNKIRSFCPECGKSTRRVAATSTSDEDMPKDKPRAITVKHVTRPKAKTTPEETQSQPPKETPKVPATRKPPARKPATKPAPKTTVARKAAPPLTQRKVAKRVSPPVAKKMPRTTRQAASKVKEEETMFTRMRKMAFGR